MKKIFGAAFAATLAVASLSSCCGKGECNAEGCDTAVAKATVDSISIAQGAYIGNAVLSNYPMIERQGNVSKEEILKGVQLVLGAPDNDGVKIGMQFGVQMLNEMKKLEELGVKVDKSLMLKNFRYAFLQDTISQNAAQRAYGYYQGLVEKVQKEQQAREEARKAQSPEALDNIAAGADFIAEAKKNDPSIQTTPSGLAYKIVNEGEGAKAGDAVRARLVFTEKKIDGQEVSSTNEKGRMTYMANITPGFAEGLKLLGKGGKAVFYVPGDIAYGVNGIPSREVGPFETIVYEVEVLEVAE